jgi:hypothetical protein
MGVRTGLVVLLTLAAGEAPGADRVYRDGFDPPETADIRALSDEFNDAATLGDWLRIWQVENWSADQLQGLDIGTTRSGWLTMVPYTSTWYANYRGELTFQNVAGNFAVTTHVWARNRGGTLAPGGTNGGGAGSEYSLAGLMLRGPRADWQVDPSASPAAWWAPGHENYVFLSFGSANAPGTYQFEVKTTTDSNSVLVISDAPAGVTEVELRSVRIAPHFIMLRREPGQAWVVHRRYRRDDAVMQGTMQAGMTVYTDWAIASTYAPNIFLHNNSVITHAYQNPPALADPDLLAQFDYVRYARPQIPPELVGADLSNPAAVSDAQLLGFLGAALD